MVATATGRRYRVQVPDPSQQVSMLRVYRSRCGVKSNRWRSARATPAADTLCAGPRDPPATPGAAASPAASGRRTGRNAAAVGSVRSGRRSRPWAARTHAWRLGSA